MPALHVALIWLTVHQVSALCVACAFVAVAFFATRGRQASTGHKRGVKLVTDTPRRQLSGLIARREPTQLTLAGVPVPADVEAKHFKLIGTTGTGKSTAIRELLGAALRRGDRAVFADPDGGYLARFYNHFRGDVVLNPFEPDSVQWDWFGELDTPYDAEQLASGLIPSTGDPSTQEWRAYARTFLTAVLQRCHREVWRDSSELWRLLTLAPVDELRAVLAGTPAQPFVDPDNARMFASIRSVTGSAAAAFQYIREQRTRPFAVRPWVRNAGATGVLFLPYKAGQIAALHGMIANWLRLAIFEAMNGPEDRDQRLWFVVDELDALGAIDGLKDALARLRKFGGRCVLGVQSISQVSTTYGAGHAQTLVENCSNTLILRCSGSENGGTSAFASKLIGEREVVRRQTTRTRDRADPWSSRDSRRSINVSDQLITETAVLSSELEQLPDFCGYLKLASSPEWRRIRLQSPYRHASAR